jgi:hypothetical protein
MEGRTCIQCNKFKPISAFGVSFDGQNAAAGYTQRVNHKRRCKGCYALRSRIKLKFDFLNMYGGQCTCCGESDPRFLTLDHVKDNGAEHRKELADNQIMMYAVRCYEPENFQILCYNCNCGRSANGGICPHKDRTLEEYLTYTKILLDEVGREHVEYYAEGLKFGPLSQKLDPEILRQHHNEKAARYREKHREKLAEKERTRQAMLRVDPVTKAKAKLGEVLSNLSPEALAKVMDLLKS